MGKVWPTESPELKAGDEESCASVARMVAISGRAVAVFALDTTPSRRV